MVLHTLFSICLFDLQQHSSSLASRALSSSQKAATTLVHLNSFILVVSVLEAQIPLAARLLAVCPARHEVAFSLTAAFD